MKKLINIAKIKIKWFASAWDLNSLRFLDQFNCEYSKIIIANKFLNEVAQRKKFTLSRQA